MGNVAIGIIGTGTIGAGHVRRIVENVPGAAELNPTSIIDSRHSA